MSWAPGREAILGMIERHHLVIVVASSDLAPSLLAQADEALETASEAALAERWYSA